MFGRNTRSPGAVLALSLGRTAAQITAQFAPIPGLYPAAELLGSIIQLCQNVLRNRSSARQLADRCHTLLLSVQDSYERSSNETMADAIDAMTDCFLDIQTRMDSWKHLSRTQSFTRQHEIQVDIERCHGAISDCLTKFQLVSHTEIHRWQEEFRVNAQRDHAELLEQLSDIQEGQNITHAVLEEQSAEMKRMMGMMQKLMGENNHNADRVHYGIASNLYSLQVETGSLLPNFHLKSGEVRRLGQFPVSGTAAMDIHEGIYLEREKVAMKVVRAVHSNEHSLRRFMREVKIWAEIWEKDRGKHVLPFYGFCQNDGPFPYMVSPWQPNGDALTYVKKHDTSVDHKRMIRGIALGVQVLHTMNPPIIHGDIKAANVFIDAYGNPLIADFGLSRVVEDITGIPFTQSRGVSDSYRWFAPEVCVGQGALSLNADIYAYAMTALEIMTHQQPYGNVKHTTEVVIKSAQGQHPTRPTDPRVIARGLDDQVWSLFKACWASEASARPPIQGVLSQLPE